MGVKCTWCARKTGELQQVEVSFRGSTETVPVCSDRCEGEVREFLAYAEKRIARFLLGLLLLPLVGLVLVFTMMELDRGAFGCFVTFASMGMVIIKYPFITPQTVKLMGLQKGIRLARIMGIVLIGLGIGCWIGIALL